MSKVATKERSPVWMTIEQIEACNPGVAGRVRQWVKRADAGDPDYIGLRDAVARVARSVLIDAHRFDAFVSGKLRKPPAPARNQKTSPARSEKKSRATR
jgi:hypothetical protein